MSIVYLILGLILRRGYSADLLYNDINTVMSTETSTEEIEDESPIHENSTDNDFLTILANVEVNKGVEDNTEDSIENENTDFINIDVDKAENEDTTITIEDLNGNLDLEFNDTSENNDMVDSLLSTDASTETTEADNDDMSIDQLNWDNTDIENYTNEIETWESTTIEPDMEIDTEVNEITSLLEEDQLLPMDNLTTNYEELEIFTIGNREKQLLTTNKRKIEQEFKNSTKNIKVSIPSIDIPEDPTDKFEISTHKSPAITKSKQYLVVAEKIVEKMLISTKSGVVPHLSNTPAYSKVTKEIPTTNDNKTTSHAISNVSHKIQSSKAIKGTKSLSPESKTSGKTEISSAIYKYTPTAAVTSKNKNKDIWKAKTITKTTAVYTTGINIIKTLPKNDENKLLISTTHKTKQTTSIDNKELPTEIEFSTGFSTILKKLSTQLSTIKTSNKNKTDRKENLTKTTPKANSGNITTSKSRKKFGLFNEATTITSTELWKFSTKVSNMAPNISTTMVTKRYSNVEEEFNSEEKRTTSSPETTIAIIISKDDIKDIAYHLRAHKFNEYDRRYESNPEKAPRTYFKEFPRPPLRSLHWEVRRYCEPSFPECVQYLRKRLRYSSFKRVDDTVVVMQDQKWTMANNSQQIRQIDEECKKLKKIDDRIADPFEGPLERFQWKATASYYMCWYTMKQIPILEHLSERCDNFANCLDTVLGPYNHDQRADDLYPYSCALYSFCPDSCCSKKHLIRPEECWNSPDNPCFESNPAGARECSVNRSLNTDFRDIILNRWNVTCKCPKAGMEWNSLYGMCIDVDECTRRIHNCDQKLEACVNLEGSFKCACKWGHIWEEKTKTCTPSAALHLIKLGRRKDAGDGKNETQSLLKRIAHFFRASNNKSSMLQPSNIAFVFSVLCILACFE